MQPPQPLKLATWNINGLRSLTAQRPLAAWLGDIGADILCVQETKLRRTDLTRAEALTDGWDSFWCFCQPGVGARSGYSGVATFVRSTLLPVATEAGLTGVLPSADAAASTAGPAAQPACSPSSLSFEIGADLDLSLEELTAIDAEGRALITDHGAFVLVNLYGPALTIEERLEERLALKLNFYRVLEWRVRRWVAAGRTVFVVGDLNISPQPIDSCKPRPDFMSRPDRQWMAALLSPTAGPGVVDAFRRFHPGRKEAFSCWNTASGARVNNYGSRIDHILLAEPGLTRSSSNEADAAAATAAAAGSARQDSDQQPQDQQQQQQQPQQQQGPAAPAAAAASQPPSLLLPLLTGCDIASEQQGSDHAPVWLTLELPPHLLPSGHAAPAGHAYAGSRMFPGRQGSMRDFFRAAQQPADQQQQQQSQELNGGDAWGSASAAQPGSQGMFSTASGSSQPDPGSLDSSAAAAAAAAGGGGTRRPAQQPASAAPAAKRAKSVPPGGKAGKAAAAAAAASKAGGQRSLHSFFSSAGGSRSSSNPNPDQPQLQSQPQSQPQSQQQPIAQVQQAHVPGSTGAPPAPPAAGEQDLAPAAAAAAAAAGGEPAVAAEVEAAAAEERRAAREAWQSIARSMQAPRCKGHNEVCVIRTVLKAGANQGRQFWCCARADGPPPVGRCSTFLWATPQRKFKGGG